MQPHTKTTTAHSVDLDIAAGYDPAFPPANVVVVGYLWRCTCGKAGPLRHVIGSDYGAAVTSARRGGQRHVAAMQRGGRG